MGREGTSTKFYNSAFLRNKGTCLWFQFQENMDFDVVVAALPALAACPPNYFIVKQVLSILMIITNHPPPPDLLVDVRDRLCVWQGRDIFCMFSDHSYGFYEITGENLETFLDLVQKTMTASMGRKIIGHNL